MKKHTLFAIVMAISFQHAFAQNNWSIGLRTGAELSKAHNLAGQDSKETGIVFHEQLFATKRILKNLELEFNAAYKSSVTNSEFVNQIWDGPEYWTNTNTYHSIDAGLALRYIVWNKKGWEPYLLGGVNASRRYTTTNTLLKEWNTPDPILHQGKNVENDIPSEFYIGLGFNKSLSPHWKLNTQLSLTYSCSGSGYYTYYAFGDFSPKAQVGLAYCW